MEPVVRAEAVTERRADQYLARIQHFGAQFTGLGDQDVDHLLRMPPGGLLPRLHGLCDLLGADLADRLTE